MNYLVNHIKLVCTFLFVTALILIYAGSRGETITEKSFVGKWKSSKLETPIYLYANGEWEIKKNDGAILQYGVWQYKAKKIIWSYKIDSSIGHDVNAVLSATPMEFQVKESDGTTTIFKRLESP